MTVQSQLGSTTETLEQQLQTAENRLRETERNLQNELAMMQDKYEEESNKSVLFGNIGIFLEVPYFGEFGQSDTGGCHISNDLLLEFQFYRMMS